MKVQLNFPNGYSADITKAREDNDFDGWVDRKFGNCIRELISNDFTLDVQDTHFVADFTYEDDAIAMTKKIGGRAID